MFALDRLWSSLFISVALHAACADEQAGLFVASLVGPTPGRRKALLIGVNYFGTRAELWLTQVVFQGIQKNYVTISRSHAVYLTTYRFRASESLDHPERRSMGLIFEIS